MDEPEDGEPEQVTFSGGVTLARQLEGGNAG